MNDIYLTRDEIEHPYANLTVMLEDKRRRAEQMSKTVFARITASPEVLAEQFVYLAMADEQGRDYWGSSLMGNEFWRTKEEAIAATVAMLRRWRSE